MLTISPNRILQFLAYAYSVALAIVLLNTNPWMWTTELEEVALLIRPDKPTSSLFLHTIAYFLMSALFWIAYRHHSKQWQWGTAIYVGVHSVTVEALQYFVPERFPNLVDVAANFLGILIFYLLLRRLGPRLLSRSHRRLIPR